MAFTSTIANLTHVKSTNHSYSQKEQDANTALLNLDRGLRSVSIGDQCEAIVRFPILFEKYPFPILVNSAFMRLSDAYRGGNNFIRLCVLKVMQESNKHLEKISNRDDLMKRVYSVIHSNDPLARAITLRTLGWLASILCEQTSVHHAVIVALDSHDMVEVDAAIFAADKFAKVSKLFSESICDKLSLMTTQLSTQVDIKQKIIPILKYMHHNVCIAQKARSVCETLLTSYPSDKFVKLTLHTMTLLSLEAVIYTASQIELLFEYIEQNARASVKHIAIKDLRLICKKAPHLWTNQLSHRLCQFLSQTRNERLTSAVLDVLIVLSKSLAINHLGIYQDSPNRHALSRALFHQSRLISSKVILLLTQIVVSQSKEDVKVYSMVNEIAKILFECLMCEASHHGQDNVSLKKLMQALVLLHSTSLDLDFFNIGVLLDVFDSFEGKRRELLAESLASIGHKNPVFLQAAAPKIIDALQKMQDVDTSDNSMTYLCTVVLQISQRTSMPDFVHAQLLRYAHSCQPWQAWKLVRQAMRYYNFTLAGDIIDSLIKQVSIEQYYVWMKALKYICDAERKIVSTSISSAIQSGTEAAHLYQRAASTLRAATSQTNSLKFQIRYTQLRGEILRKHVQLLVACATFSKCPPPAVAAALAVTSNKDVSRSGPIIPQLERCLEDYRELNRCLSHLHKQSFDADHTSLANIVFMQRLCSFLEAAIETLIHSKPFGWVPVKVDRGCDRAFGVFSEIADTLTEVLSKVATTSLTYGHIDALRSATVRLMTSSLGYPRHFFQQIQSTTIKVAVTSPSSDSIITTSSHTQLTVKVEGVVEQVCQASRFCRKVCGVNIYVTSSLTTKHPNHMDSKIDEPSTNNLRQFAEQHNDYFSVNFLLSFPIPGRHCVRLNVHVLDETQHEWNTGPELEFFVKSCDDVASVSKIGNNNKPVYKGGQT